MIVKESIEINASIDKVWTNFIKLNCWGNWNTVLRYIPSSETECITEGKKFQCCISPFEIPLYFETKIEEFVANERIVWSVKKYGISARHEYSFTKSDNGVLLNSRETFTGITVSVMGRLFPKWKIRKLTLLFLEELKKISES